MNLILIQVNQRTDANCMEEEADSWLLLHVANPRAESWKDFLVLSNDSDVVKYLSAYFD